MIDLNSNIVWNPNIEKHLLIQDEVHLFLADLKLSSSKREHYWNFLNNDEKQQALRFKFEHHRERFIASKGILRQLLSDYLLNVTPIEIRFRYGSHGKPYLEDKFYSHLFFNMTHSENVALYALTLNREIGIDVEYLRDDVEYEDLAKRFFSTQESQELGRLPKAQKHLAFFKAWTCKEAFIKAVGEGLSFPLRQFDIDVNPDKPAALLSIRGNHKLAQKWVLMVFKPSPEYMAALAVDGIVKSMKFWRFQT